MVRWHYLVSYTVAIRSNYVLRTTLFLVGCGYGIPGIPQYFCLLKFFWCPCMAIDVSVSDFSLNNGKPLPDIIF